MSDQPSTAYRNPKVEDDDEDDLDDLDDVLASFNAPTASRAPPSAQAGPSTQRPQPPSAPAGGNGDDFEASLAEGMESLLRQLAGDHPPGPMPGTSSAPDRAEGEPLSKEEEEAAWQRAVEMMLSGEGLDALGLDPSGAPQGVTSSGGDAKRSSGSGAGLGGTGATGKAGASGAEQPDFNETIRRTMEQLKSPPKGGASAEGDDLAKLLASLGGLGGEGEGDDDDLGGLLDGMMAQLMTKEVLEEPMSELASKYPAYLASPPEGVSAEDLNKYRKQHKLVTQITDTFRKPGYSDEKDGKDIARLVSEMQDLGGPPAEIMGELPEGFDLNALGGGEEGCTIM